MAGARRYLVLLGLLQCSEAIEVYRSYSGALFEQTLLEVLEFEFGKVGFEQVLIAINITKMGTQTGMPNMRPFSNFREFGCFRLILRS